MTQKPPRPKRSSIVSQAKLRQLVAKDDVPPSVSADAAITERPAAKKPLEMELADFLGQSPDAPLNTSLKVCIVTNELAEFHQNGGLGTATSGLIHALISRGLTPTILYTAKLDLSSPSVQAGQKDIQKTGAEFIALQEHVPAYWMDVPRKIAYGCYWLLRNEDFDVIHFNDYLGNGFYVSQSRRTASNFPNTTIIVTVHGPTRWAMSIDQRPMASVDIQEVSFLELRTLEFSDVVLGVSHHLIGWLRGVGVTLPKHTYVHKNILPLTSPSGTYKSLAPGLLSEVVFFARQDVRKGFLIFLDTIKRVAPDLPHVKFTFLGKFSNIAQEHSGAVALDVLSAVPNLINFCHDYDRDRAISYLMRPGVLAVMPSVDENSPCTVFECIRAGVPFVTTMVGGIPELVAPKNHADVLVEPAFKPLAQRIRNIASNGFETVALAFDPAIIEEQMIQGFDRLHGVVQSESVSLRKAVDSSKLPLVSVVITHFNRPLMLKNLLATLEHQSYQNFEVVVVDDGSTNADAAAFIANLNAASYSYQLKVVRIANSYLGAARNAGVKHAAGDYIKFQDDDNIPFRWEIEDLVRAAMVSEADVVTGMSRFFRTEAEAESGLSLQQFEYFPLGASLPLSISRNEYGDANSLVRTAAFRESGGFTEIYGVGSEDHEFFVMMESTGRKMMFVPKPLFNYRVAGGSMLQSTSAYRGAQRAKSGLKVTESRWLSELISAHHEAQLDRDIRHTAWWRAGSRKHGELHQQMLEGDPNSDSNINRFLELAAKYERLEDMIHLVLKKNSLLESLQWLEDMAKRFQQLQSGRNLLKTRARILHFRDFDSIELLEPTADLPIEWSLWRVENEGIMVHPLVGRVTKVMVPGIIPAGTHKVTVPFSHRGPKGEPIGMAFEVRRSGRLIETSPWVQIFPGGKAESALFIHEESSEACDLVLMSTVEKSQDWAWGFADFVSVKLKS